ncbi:MAG: trehalose-phosphatase, partial [Candidatus Omnitrophica bacterium]|nr:trehalose-phosphatase [Candidatus Omnitrophota bacterium]
YYYVFFLQPYMTDDLSFKEFKKVIEELKKLANSKDAESERLKFKDRNRVNQIIARLSQGEVPLPPESYLVDKDGLIRQKISSGKTHYKIDPKEFKELENLFKINWEKLKFVIVANYLLNRIGEVKYSVGEKILAIVTSNKSFEEKEAELKKLLGFQQDLEEELARYLKRLLRRLIKNMKGELCGVFGSQIKQIDSLEKINLNLENLVNNEEDFILIVKQISKLIHKNDSVLKLIYYKLFDNFKKLFKRLNKIQESKSDSEYLIIDYVNKKEILQFLKLVRLAEKIGYISDYSKTASAYLENHMTIAFRILNRQGQAVGVIFMHLKSDNNEPVVSKLQIFLNDNYLNHKVLRNIWTVMEAIAREMGLQAIVRLELNEGILFNFLGGRWKIPKVAAITNEEDYEIKNRCTKDLKKKVQVASLKVKPAVIYFIKALKMIAEKGYDFDIVIFIATEAIPLRWVFEQVYKELGFTTRHLVNAEVHLTIPGKDESNEEKIERIKETLAKCLRGINCEGRRILIIDATVSSGSTLYAVKIATERFAPKAENIMTLGLFANPAFLFEQLYGVPERLPDFLAAILGANDNKYYTTTDWHRKLQSKRNFGILKNKFLEIIKLIQKEQNKKMVNKNHKLNSRSDGGNENKVSITPCEAVEILCKHLRKAFLEQLDFEASSKFYQLLKEALNKREFKIYYVAAGRSGHASTMFAILLNLYGFEVIRRKQKQLISKHLRYCIANWLWPGLPKDLETQIIYRIDTEEQTPSVKEGDLIIAVTGSGSTPSVNRYLHIAKEQGARIVALTANPNAEIWKELEPEIIIEIAGRTKLEHPATSFEYEQQLARFKRAAPMGTSFELSVGLYLMAMIEALMKKLDTKEELEKCIRDYLNLVISWLETKEFKINLMDERIEELVNYIEHIRKKKKNKIYISGDGISHKIALLFMTRLRQLDVPVDVAGVRHVQSRLNKGDIAIVIGANSNEQKFKEVIKTAREVKAKVVAITALENLELEKEVDLAFFLPGTVEEAGKMDFVELNLRGEDLLSPGDILFWPLTWFFTEAVISQFREEEMGHVQWQLEYPATVWASKTKKSTYFDFAQKLCPPISFKTEAEIVVTGNKIKVKVDSPGAGFKLNSLHSRFLESLIENALQLKELKEAFIGMANAPPNKEKVAVNLPIQIEHNTPSKLAFLKDGRLHLHYVLVSAPILFEQVQKYNLNPLTKKQKQDLSVISSGLRILAQDVIIHELSHWLLEDSTETQIRNKRLEHLGVPEITALLYLDSLDWLPITFDNGWRQLLREKLFNNKDGGRLNRFTVNFFKIINKLLPRYRKVINSNTLNIKYQLGEAVSAVVSTFRGWWGNNGLPLQLVSRYIDKRQKEQNLRLAERWQRIKRTILSSTLPILRIVFPVTITKIFGALVVTRIKRKSRKDGGNKEEAENLRRDIDTLLKHISLASKDAVTYIKPNEIKLMVKRIKAGYENPYFRNKEDFGEALKLLQKLAQINPEVTYQALRYHSDVSYEQATQRLREWKKIITPVLGDKVFRELEKYVQIIKQQGKTKMVIFNATFVGGGVAEMMPTLAYLLMAYGLKLDWHIIYPLDPAFYEVTKKIHNNIQGNAQEVTAEEWQLYEKVMLENAKLFRYIFTDPDAFLIAVEDPQVTGLIPYIVEEQAKAGVYIPLAPRYHIDFSGVEQGIPESVQVWEKLLSYLKFLTSAEQTTFQENTKFSDFGISAAIQNPGIDVTNDKNQPLKISNNPYEDEAATIIFGQLKDELGKSIIELTQEGKYKIKKFIITGSRFDYWKGHYFVLLAFASLVKKDLIDNDINLLIFGNYASDDPEGSAYYQKILKTVDTLEPEIKNRIYIIKEPQGKQVGALYRLAAYHKLPYIAFSIREGFNLMVDEASAQKTAVIVTDVGGLGQRFLNRQGSAWIVKINEFIKGIKDMSWLTDKKNEQLPEEYSLTDFQKKKLVGEFVRLLAEKIEEAVNTSEEHYQKVAEEGYKLMLEHTLIFMLRDYLKRAVESNVTKETKDGGEKQWVVIRGGGFLRKNKTDELFKRELEKNLQKILPEAKLEILDIPEPAEAALMGTASYVMENKALSYSDELSVVVDVGGTSVEIALYDRCKQQLTNYRIMLKNISEITEPADFYFQIGKAIVALKKKAEADGKKVSAVIGMAHPGSKLNNDKIAKGSNPNMGDTNKRNFELINPAYELEKALKKEGNFRVLWLNDALAQALGGYQQLRRKLINKKVLYLGLGTGLGTAFLETDQQGRIIALSESHIQHSPEVVKQSPLKNCRISNKAGIVRFNSWPGIISVKAHSKGCETFVGRSAFAKILQCCAELAKISLLEDNMFLDEWIELVLSSDNDILKERISEIIRLQAILVAELISYICLNDIPISRHFNNWVIANKQRIKNKKIIIFLDYDGTLAEITPVPSQAKLSEEMQETIQRLNSLSDVLVVIVSGRKLEDVKTMVGIRGILYVGNHGLEIGNNSIPSEALEFSCSIRKDLIEKIEKSLRKQKTTKENNDVWIEDKTYTLTIHCPDAEFGKVWREVVKLISTGSFKNKVKIDKGKNVIELKPKINCDKGVAVKNILEKIDIADAIIIAIGDDQTDENMFREVNKRKGTTASVGNTDSSAKYYLKNVSEVQEGLKKIIKLKEEGKQNDGGDTTRDKEILAKELIKQLQKITVEGKKIEVQDPAIAKQQMQQLLNRNSVIFIINRGPFGINWRKDTALEITRSAGGAAPAIYSALLDQGGVVFCSPITDTEKILAKKGKVLKLDNNIWIRYLDIPAKEYKNYYNVIANPILWFIQHNLTELLISRPTLKNILSYLPLWLGYLLNLQNMSNLVFDRETRQAYFEGYVKVNQLFAKDVGYFIKEIPNLKILIQDYHFYPLAKMLRDENVGARIGLFLHIPWPEKEYIKKSIPQDILRSIVFGLANNDIVFFHTVDYQKRFMQLCQEILSAEIDLKTGLIKYTDDKGLENKFFTKVRPISIDSKRIKQQLLSSKTVEYIKNTAPLLRDKIVISIGARIDPTKGLVEALEAFRQILFEYPKLRDKLILLVMLGKERDIPQYHQLKAKIIKLTEEINSKFKWNGIIYNDEEIIRPSRKEEVPFVILNISDKPFEKVLGAYVLADIILVTPVADGENLVAHEGLFVNNKDNRSQLSKLTGEKLEPVVEVLSTNAGAYRRLEQAVFGVEPSSVKDIKDKLYRAIKLTLKYHLLFGKKPPKKQIEFLNNWASKIITKESTSEWLEKLIRDLEEIEEEKDTTFVSNSNRDGGTSEDTLKDAMKLWEELNSGSSDGYLKWEKKGYKVLGVEGKFNSKTQRIMQDIREFIQELVPLPKKVAEPQFVGMQLTEVLFVLFENILQHKQKSHPTGKGIIMAKINEENDCLYATIIAVDKGRGIKPNQLLKHNQGEFIGFKQRRDSPGKGQGTRVLSHYVDNLVVVSKGGISRIEDKKVVAQNIIKDFSAVNVLDLEGTAIVAKINLERNKVIRDGGQSLKSKNSINTEEVRKRLEELASNFGKIKAACPWTEAPSEEVIDYFILACEKLNEYLGQGIKRNIVNILVDTNGFSRWGERFLYLNNKKELTIKNKERLKQFIKWFKQSIRKGDDPYRTATEAYIIILAGENQMFDEANHRTGNLIMNLILLLFGQSPFIISEENASTYFELSYEIKYGNILDFKFKNLLKHLNPYYEKTYYIEEFAKFLKNNLCENCVKENKTDKFKVVSNSFKDGGENKLTVQERELLDKIKLIIYRLLFQKKLKLKGKYQITGRNDIINYLKSTENVVWSELDEEGKKLLKGLLFDIQQDIISFVNKLLALYGISSDKIVSIILGGSVIEFFATKKFGNEKFPVGDDLDILVIVKGDSISTLRIGAYLFYHITEKLAVYEREGVRVADCFIVSKKALNTYGGIRDVVVYYGGVPIYGQPLFNESEPLMLLARIETLLKPSQYYKKGRLRVANWLTQRLAKMVGVEIKLIPSVKIELKSKESDEIRELIKDNLRKIKLKLAKNKKLNSQASEKTDKQRKEKCNAYIIVKFGQRDGGRLNSNRVERFYQVMNKGSKRLLLKEVERIKQHLVGVATGLAPPLGQIIGKVNNKIKEVIVSAQTSSIKAYLIKTFSVVLGWLKQVLTSTMGWLRPRVTTPSSSLGAVVSVVTKRVKKVIKVIKENIPVLRDKVIALGEELTGINWSNWSDIYFTSILKNPLFIITLLSVAGGVLLWAAQEYGFAT